MKYYSVLQVYNIAACTCNPTALGVGFRSIVDSTVL